MNPRLLSTCLVLAPTLLPAQEPVLLSQSFDLRHYRWQAGDEKANGSTQAVYDLILGLPVFTYRLGSLALLGSVEYNKLTLEGQSEANTGLNRYGMRMYLFPYRPFKVQVDYLRSKTPGLLGIEPVRGETLGIGTGYRGGRWIQDVELLFRRGVTHQAGEKETWTTWTLNANQRFGSTEAILQAVRQAFNTSEPVPGWNNLHLHLRTESRLAPNWRLRTNWGGESSMGSRWTDGDASLLGNLGSWSTISTLGLRDTRWSGTDIQSSLVGQTFSYMKGPLQFASSAVFTRVRTDSEAQDAKISNQSGATYNLGVSYGFLTQWRVSTNLAVSSQSGLVSDTTGRDSRTLTTTLVGLSRGGDLPDLVRHTLYMVSNWAFNRQVREDYPPGYLPAELSDQLLQRRMRQRGQLGFSLDAGRTSAKGEPGRLDFAHVSGDLRAGRRLRMMVLGDWRRDEGFSLPGNRRMERALTGNASLLLGSYTSLTGTLGTSRTSLETLAGMPSTPVSPQNPQYRETNYRALSLQTRFWRIPFGVLSTRYEPSVGPTATSQSAHADLDFRQISFRVAAERARQEGLPTNNRLVVSLRRYFDTIALW